jgi:Leu/Phe-tRNA-protein transferase
MENTEEVLLRLYANAYIERDAKLLLDSLSSVMQYSRQSEYPSLVEKHAFIDFLNGRFKEQKKTAYRFQGIIKLVNNNHNKPLLYMKAMSQEILISIKIDNKVINRIDVQGINQEIYDKEIIYDSTKEDYFLEKVKYSMDGYIIIEPQNDPNEIMDIIIKTKYDREYCISYSFDSIFISNLMSAGFLVMSKYKHIENKNTLVVLPMHHITRSILNFRDLHISRTQKRYIKQYTLKFDHDFEKIINKCVNIHRSVWLSKELVDAILKIKHESIGNINPVSFGVYKNGELKAGEFGIISGKVFTSYSGYHEENNAGTIQMILTAKYLSNHNFSFWDLGMPLKYKQGLGAININLEEFLQMFRKANK